MRIVLGVGAGIAAYKSAILLRRMTEAGHDVRVVPTRASLEFVGRATWEALSGHPATPDVFDDVPSVAHVRVGQEADLVIVAPATADLLARAAGGHADDLLTATLLTATCPVLMAPAMHTEMWLHPATRANVRTLRDRGVHVMEPDSGRLTGPDSGPGRLPEPDVIASAALALVAPADLAGRRVVVSAGGTREPLDPVRYLGNRSSGLQGVAVARAAASRGADVVLVAANVTVPVPSGMDVRAVGTAEELTQVVLATAEGADVVVMAAAVADFRPAEVSEHKIKKDGRTSVSVVLEPTTDVLTALVARRRPGQVVVGFAAETGDLTAGVLEHGTTKARRKGADLMVVNAVGTDRGFGVAHNDVVVLAGDGSEVTRASGSKEAVAHVVLDQVVPRLGPVPVPEG